MTGCRRRAASRPPAWLGCVLAAVSLSLAGCTGASGSDDDAQDGGGSLYDDPLSVLDTLTDTGEPRPWLDAIPDEPTPLPDAGTPDGGDEADHGGVPDSGGTADAGDNDTADSADVPAPVTPIGWDDDNPVSLIDHNLWQHPTPGPGTDPFWPQDSAAAAAIKPCPPEGIEVELEDIDSWVEVDTTSCGWATMSQPALVGAQPGDKLRIRVWRWKILDGDGGYSLHIHLGAPDALELIWAESLDVPGKSGLWVGTYGVKAPIAPGTPVWWHVQNHGINTWNLIEIARLDAIYPP